MLCDSIAFHTARETPDMFLVIRQLWGCCFAGALIPGGDLLKMVLVDVVGHVSSLASRKLQRLRLFDG